MIDIAEVGRRETLRQLALRPDGLRLLLGWLARQVDGEAVVVTGDQDAREALSHLPEEMVAPVDGMIRRVAAGRARSAALDAGSRTVYVAAVGAEDPRITLVVTWEGALSPMRDMVTEASGYLWLRWRVEELQRERDATEQADATTREAVLHLLMTGHVHEARRVTGALGTRLADVIRVYVVECPPGLREKAVRSCEQATGRHGWLIRCPVYTRHLIILAPSAPREADRALNDGLQAWVRNRPGCYVGAGHAVALRDTASGYEQAFHALAVARSGAGRCATFSSRTELPSLIDRSGYGWAYRRLRPLLDHRARRPQDPDAGELRATLTAWLAFSTRASRLLKIHRNTLAARLRLLGELLGDDVHDLSTCAELDLALRILDRRHGPTEQDAVPLDRLLAAPEVLHWATALLDGISRADAHLGVTLRTWLDSDANVAATATSLNLSVPAIRKRLLRIEQITERSLLNGPSSLYDLRLAFRTVDQQDPPV
ncbi:helix-turn-helix domain-containing protein [Streptomyces sp. TS71-3]|uniref:helix-turn-helix domain-containing protein n=1 Tax=Streptomyces sp. TS71-3 TaxID=2733862 RepID=UPI001B2635EE|nr:helix-turn-helix domain-containing protein [Streptomyces sp. TS71-3]GHJ37440.1 DNA-binding protein [Streptomyces sp. TS71-3]